MAGFDSETLARRWSRRLNSARTCGFQIRCFVFSATLTEYPAASAAFLSLRPLSFPNKNNRCLFVRPFLSSDLRRLSCSSRVGGFGSSKSSGLKSCEIRCFIAALSETIILLERPIDLPTRLRTLAGVNSFILPQAYIRFLHPCSASGLSLIDCLSLRMGASRTSSWHAFVSRFRGCFLAFLAIVLDCELVTPYFAET